MSEAGVAVPLGHPNGIIVRAAGEPTVYHMGDTDIFGDMALINEIYQPKIRDRADRRSSFHRGRKNRCNGGQAVFPLRCYFPAITALPQSSMLMHRHSRLKSAGPSTKVVDCAREGGSGNGVTGVP